jgi:hypothetical protein
VLLAGILMSYVIPFVVLAKPTPLSSAVLIIFLCRELCYVLLAGILTSYVIPFVVLAKPTPLIAVLFL